MCNCLKESTKKILGFVKMNLAKEGKKIAEWNDADSGYVNRALSFGDNGGWKLIMPFEVKYTPVKANGTNGREVTYKTNIFPAFCPFCGKKTDKSKMKPINGEM